MGRGSAVSGWNAWVLAAQEPAPQAQPTCCACSRIKSSYSVGAGRLWLRAISILRRLDAEVAKPLAWSMSSEALGEADTTVSGGELGGVSDSATRDEALLSEASILAMKLFRRGSEPRRGDMMLTSDKCVRFGGSG